jgi:hypothetical protein
MLSGSPLAAQRVGFTFGSTKSDVVSWSGRTGGSYPDRSGLTAGITYRGALRPGFGWQTEALFVQRGWSVSQPTLAMSYIDIPVLVRIGALPESGGRLRPVLSVGPTMGVLVNCSLTGVGTVTVAGSGCSQRIVAPFERDYRVRRFDAGLLLGLGSELRFDDGMIAGVELRYERGLLDIMPGAPGDSRNRTISIVANVVPSRSKR